jgi:hypothetical protein
VVVGAPVGVVVGGAVRVGADAVVGASLGEDDGAAVCALGAVVWAALVVAV